MAEKFYIVAGAAIFSAIMAFLFMWVSVAEAACAPVSAYCSFGFGNSNFNGTWELTGTNYNGYGVYQNTTTASSTSKKMYITDNPTRDYWGMSNAPTEGAGAYAIGPSAVQCPDAPGSWGMDSQGQAPTGIVVQGACSGPAPTSTVATTSITIVPNTGPNLAGLMTIGFLSLGGIMIATRK